MVNTPNGYDFHELFSAMQKCIRRSMEYEAVQFAAELERFNRTALWNRLKIIASEDIGPANPIMPILIETLATRYFKLKEDLTDESHKLFMVNAVVCLRRSPKSRITDDLLNVVYKEREDECKVLEIPDFALDSHTARGKTMNRGTEFFYTIGNQLENEAFANPYTERAKELAEKYREK